MDFRALLYKQGVPCDGHVDSRLHPGIVLALFVLLRICKAKLRDFQLELVEGLCGK